MRYKHSVFIISGVATLLTSALPFSTSMAQESISATGGEASGSGGSTSYTIGQAVYSINTGSNGTEVQGVQQPFEIMVLKTTEEANDISLAISAYLATSGQIVLSVTKLDVLKYSYQLFDLNGKLLEKKKLEGNPTNIDMRKYPISVYLVRVFFDEKELKTFKVIKNK